MKVALAGATGKVGAPLLTELLTRGHDVVALVRDPARLPEASGRLDAVGGDVFDPAALSSVAARCEVLVAAVALRDPAQQERTPVQLARALMAAASAAGVRLLMLGGAGSLRTASGEDFVDTAAFPDVARPESLGFREALQALRSEAPPELEWAMLCPPARIEPDGERTGEYRVGVDDLVLDADGSSHVSAADLAVALADEIEHPAHRRARFTVGAR